MGIKQKKIASFMLCGVLLVTALILSCMAEPSGARLDNLLFRLGMNHDAEEKLVRKAVREYNAATSGIYSTSGLAIQELDVIPASDVEKRRIYKDVNLLRTDGLLVVFDRDKETIESVEFLNRQRVTVVSSETWVLKMQDFATRRALTNLKGSQVRCRYHLWRIKGRWLVDQVEVFPVDEKMPPLNIKPAL